MKHRPHRDAGWKCATSAQRTALVLACLGPAAAGCARTVMEGRAASMLYDPDRVGGLPATHGFSGLRPDAPRRKAPSRARTEAPSIGFRCWQSTTFKTSGRRLPSIFSGQLHACLGHEVLRLDKSVKRRVCGRTVIYGDPNASYCPRDDSVSWDRGSLIPNARKYFGDIAVAGVLAHEFGHAVQTRAHLVHAADPHDRSRNSRPTASPGSTCTGWPRAAQLGSL